MLVCLKRSKVCEKETTSVIVTPKDVLLYQKGKPFLFRLESFYSWEPHVMTTKREPYGTIVLISRNDI